MNGQGYRLRVQVQIKGKLLESQKLIRNSSISSFSPVSEVVTTAKFYSANSLPPPPHNRGTALPGV